MYFAIFILGQEIGSAVESEKKKKKRKRKKRFKDDSEVKISNEGPKQEKEVLTPEARLVSSRFRFLNEQL